MADNIVAPGVGAVIAADDIEGVKYQIVKVGFSLPDATPTHVSSSNRLPVDIGSNSLTVGGTVGISGTVQVAGAFYPNTQAVSAQNLPLPAGASTETTLAALAAKLPTSLGPKASGTSLSIVPATSSDMATDSNVKLVGTRAYATPVARVAVASQSAQSAAIPASEVLVHASTRCFIWPGDNPTATVNGIPLEAGEKFHLRITANQKIAVLRDTADGFLNIVPVA